MKPPVRWRNCSRSRRMAGTIPRRSPGGAQGGRADRSREGATSRTVAAGWGEGATAAPTARLDGKPSRAESPGRGWRRFGGTASRTSWASTGTPPSLFVDADGTAQREAVRRWHLGTVLPLARILESELTVKLEAAVRLQFDAYPLDLAGRAMASRSLWPAA